MKKISVFLAFCIAILLFSPARSQTASTPLPSSTLSEAQFQEMHQVGILEKTMYPKDILEALSDVSAEFDRCGEFYLLGWALAKNSGAPPTLRLKIYNVANAALHYAFYYGRSSGMSTKAIQAMGDMFAKELAGQIGSNGNNYIILMHKYGSSCSGLLSDVVTL